VFGYYVDNSQLDYGGYLRATYRLRKSVEVTMSGGYRSSGTGSNTGSQTVELSLAMRIFL
jgi:hypothetical protein